MTIFRLLTKYACFCFQGPYSRITYEVIGDDNAPVYFGINAVSGQLFTKESLTNDTSLSYRVSYNSNNCLFSAYTFYSVYLYI